MTDKLVSENVRCETKKAVNLSPQVLYLENESWLRTVVRSRVPEPEAVEDIMQNIAMALVRQKDQLAEIQQVGSWLYQVAVKQVLMHRRSRGRFRKFQKKLIQQSEAGAVPLVDQAGPVDHVLAAEKQDQVREALSELDELDRQILMLKYSENWTYRDLAEHMGIKEDTVEYRLARARKRLRKRLLQTMKSETAES